MDVKKYFTDMYYYIWQSNDINKLDQYYAKDFSEIIHVCDEQKRPIELTMNYAEIVKQAKWQKENYKDTTFDIKKIVAGADNHISVHFYSSSVDRKTGELRHRCVCGIWHLNQNNQIDRVWAVVTPYYPA